MAFDAEVIVVGAGPAGLATALGLRARGREVLVLERARPGRDKPCGEGLLPHGVDALRRLGLAPPPEARPFRGITYRSGKTVAVGDFPGGRWGIGVRRTVLDRALLEHATERGIEVHSGARVLALEGEAGAISLRTEGGSLRARMVVGADGPRSLVRRACGLDGAPRGRRRWALRRHHRLLAGVPDPERVEVALLDGAEVYLTPVAPGVVNVALLCEDELAPTFRGDRDGAHARLVAREPAIGERLGEAVSETLATGPLRSTARGAVADGVLLVGDAAGFVDGITGEGMSLTLQAAEIAAEVASAALVRGTLDRRSLLPYERRRGRRVALSNRMSELVLLGIRHRWLAARVIRGFARDRGLFDRLLALDAGEGSALDLVALARAVV